MRYRADGWQKSIVSLIVFALTGAPLVVAAGSSCTLDTWSFTDGQSTTTYQAASVAYGSQCVSETRTCNNGTMSGSYTFAACTVAPQTTTTTPPPPAVTPPPSSGMDPNLLLAAFGITAAMWLASQGVANEQCKEFKGTCKYKTKCNPKGPATPENTGIVGKPCSDPRGVSGACEKYKVCKATGVSGFGGGGAGSGGMMDALKTAMTLAQLLAMMNAANSSSNGSSPTGPTGCRSFYQVATPTPQDPCAYYVPGSNSISSGINNSFTDTPPPPPTSSASDLFNELYGNNGDVSGKFKDDIANIASSTIDISRVTGATATTTNGRLGAIPLNGGVNAGLISGVSGNVVITDRGATVIVSRQGTSSTVAGFYGSESTGGATAQTGMVASWCRARPWANNFLRYIIPATFFDSLCTLRGYQVGIDAPTRSPGLNTTNIRPNPSTSFTSTPVLQGSTTKPIYTGPKPQVDIWAIPASTKLGSRTTVFWTAKNVTSCVESSPDGNFAQNTLSGGAATVALSGPTTFTISCNALDGTHPVDYVTVNTK